MTLFFLLIALCVLIILCYFDIYSLSTGNYLIFLMPILSSFMIELYHKKNKSKNKNIKFLHFINFFMVIGNSCSILENAGTSIDNSNNYISLIRTPLLIETLGMIGLFLIVIPKSNQITQILNNLKNVLIKRHNNICHFFVKSTTVIGLLTTILSVITSVIFKASSHQTFMMIYLGGTTIQILEILKIWFIICFGLNLGIVTEPIQSQPSEKISNKKMTVSNFLYIYLIVSVAIAFLSIFINGGYGYVNDTESYQFYDYFIIKYIVLILFYIFTFYSIHKLKDCKLSKRESAFFMTSNICTITLAMNEIGTVIIILCSVLILSFIYYNRDNLLSKILKLFPIGVLAFVIFNIYRLFNPIDISSYITESNSSFASKLTRIAIWLNPNSSLDTTNQQLKGLQAIAKSSMFGGVSNDIDLYVADDSIIAHITSVEGLLMLVILMICSVFFFFYILDSVQENSNNNILSVMGIGSALMLIIPILISYGTSLDLIPVIGIPFPFISSGNSCIVGSMLLIYLVTLSATNDNISPVQQNTDNAT